MDGSPEGQVLICTNCTTVDLSPSDTKRWVARRKAAVVTAVRNGLEEACRHYELSEEEFLAWKWGIANRGVAGLRITRCKSTIKPLGRDRQRRGTEHKNLEERGMRAL
jgi:Protein of unknown function (DUF1153)